jgi:hypothetical protein
LARGGVRLPVIDVPLGVNRGDVCNLLGTYRAFSDAELIARYPTRTAFLNPFAAGIERSVAQGTLLREDADLLIRRAQSLKGPWDR